MKRIPILVLAALILSLTLGVSLGFGGNDAAAQGPPRVIGVDGVGNVGGQPVLVHILAVVHPGENAAAVARSVLAAQGARPFTSADFSLTGLDWKNNSSPDWDPDHPVVVQNYNPSGDPIIPQGPDPVDGAQALRTSQATWSTVAGSVLTIAFGDLVNREPSLVRESAGKQAFDGYNDVAWMDLKGKNTLAVTWSGTSGGVPEADVAMNTDFDWFTDGSEFDAETVFLHEGGHVIGIGHSDEIGAVMEATYAGVRTSLHEDDEAAVLALYRVPNEAPVVMIINPDDGDIFVTDATINFTGSASDEDDVDLAADLVWTSNIDDAIGSGANPSTSLSDGVHIITAAVLDSGGATGSDSITITVGTPASATIVSVVTPSVEVGYSTSGGKGGDRNLRVTVALVDDLLNDVAGASVSIRLANVSTEQQWTGIATTGDDGSVTFQLRNAPSGDYETTVTAVVADGLTWDGVTPENSFEK